MTDQLTNETNDNGDQDFYTEDEIAVLGGLSAFATIIEKPDVVSQELWELYCHCEGAGAQFRGWGYDEVGNWWYHVGCGKPRPHWGIIIECDLCGDYFRPDRLPERNFQCQDCA